MTSIFDKDGQMALREKYNGSGLNRLKEEVYCETMLAREEERRDLSRRMVVLPRMAFWGGATKESVYDLLVTDGDIMETMKKGIEGGLVPKGEVSGEFLKVEAELLSEAATVSLKSSLGLIGSLKERAAAGEMTRDEVEEQLKRLVIVRDLTIEKKIIGTPNISVGPGFAALLWTDEKKRGNPEKMVFIPKEN